MEDIIIDFHYLFIGITVFLGIALVGYIKENKNLKGKATINNITENTAVSNVSIADLENGGNNLNV